MSRRAKTLLWTIAGALLISCVLFAPLFTAGICVDAQDTSRSYCRDWQTSLIGMETSVWLWLGGSVVLVAVAILVSTLAARRGGRGAPDAPTPADRA